MVFAFGCPAGTVWSWSGVRSAITLSRPSWSRLMFARMKSAAVSMEVSPRLPLYHVYCATSSGSEERCDGSVPARLGAADHPGRLETTALANSQHLKDRKSTRLNSSH